MQSVESAAGRRGQWDAIGASGRDETGAPTSALDLWCRRAMCEASQMGTRSLRNEPRPGFWAREPESREPTCPIMTMKIAHNRKTQ